MFRVETRTREQCGSSAPLSAQGLAGTLLLGHFLALAKISVIVDVLCHAAFNPLRLVSTHTVVSTQQGRRMFHEAVLRFSSNGTRLRKYLTALPDPRDMSSHLGVFRKRLGLERFQRVP